MHDHAHHAMSPLGLEQLSTVLGALLLGLSGAVGHCALMCGGFVVALDRVRAGGPGGLDGGRAGWGAHLLYHAGRTTTYMALALALGAIGPALGAGGWQATRLAWMALLGIVLMALAIDLVAPRASGLSKLAGWFGRHLGRHLRALLSKPGGVFLGGMAWGAIPCMLSWGAIAAAATQPPPQTVAMIAAFGLGTAAPLLGLRGVLTRLPRQRWLGRAVAAGALLVYGGWMVARAVGA